MKKPTKQEFLERVLKRVKRPVDLSQFEYINTSTKSTAICPEHGPFQISPNALMNRIGCPVCALIERSDKRRMTLTEFISKAKDVHGDKYDYSLVEYTSAQKKVKIICPEHGEFQQVANSHLSGKGCAKCRNDQTGDRCRMSSSEFVSRCTEKHGNTYDLSRVNYTSMAKKIEVICPTHGSFFPVAGNFAGIGSGCPTCGRDAVGVKSRKNLAYYVTNGAKTHLGAYGYSGIVHKKTAAYLRVVCPAHGEFLQLAQDHMKGIGCRDCAKFGFSTSLPATLYIYRITGRVGDYLGFGVTNNLDTRHKQHAVTFRNDGFSGELIKVVEFESGFQALKVETMLKRSLDCVDTGLEGFRTEAVPYRDIDMLMRLL